MARVAKGPTTEQRMARAVELVLEAGYEPDGATASASVRTGSASAPIYGGIGGVVSTVGGRSRFARPDSSARVTVGPRTVCFYQVENGQAVGHRSVETRDEERLREVLAEIVPAGPTP